MTTQPEVLLRQARERQGRSLAEVAGTLGVPAEELAAIERGELAGASRRAVLRMYAHALELDAERLLLDAAEKAARRDPIGTVPPPPDIESAASTTTRPRRGRRRLIIVLVVAGALVIAAGAVWVGIGLARARTAGLAGGDAIEQARAELRDGHAAAAVDELARAHHSFALTEDRLRGPLMRVAAEVPVAGRSVRAARAQADAGALAADAARDLLAEVVAQPGGVTALAPRDGSLPVATFEQLAPAIADAADRVAAARSRIEDSPERLLVSPLRALRRRAEEQLGALHKGLHGAAALTAHAGSLLGDDEPRRYLFGAQNPAELRGTGGLIGAWTVLTIDDGDFRFGEFDTIGRLTAADPRQVDAPHPQFASRYARFAAAGHGSNVNMTPHLPWAARALLNLHQRRPGARPLDGVILADPAVVAAMLRATGPVDLPRVGRLSADDAVAYLTNEVYDDLAEGRRKAVLGRAAVAALERFLSEADTRTMLATLGDVVGGGHLSVYARHDAVQQALATAGAAGTFDPPEHADFLAVVLNNASATKLDFYLDQEIVYDVELRADGRADVTTTVRLTNDAPTSGRSQTVLGPNVDGFEAGEHRLRVSTFGAPGCQLTSTTRDGQRRPLTAERERGAPTFPSFIKLGAGQTTDLVYRWQVPGAWHGDRSGGRYRLEIHGQPRIRPVEATVRVRLPDGTEATTTSHGVRNDGQMVVWRGPVGDGATIDVEFAAPVLQRARHRVASWLDVE